MKNAITTATIKLPERTPKTKEWDPSKMITTGNIEKVQAQNKKDKGKK
jgi:hypothetical protein